MRTYIQISKLLGIFGMLQLALLLKSREYKVFTTEFNLKIDFESG